MSTLDYLYIYLALNGIDTQLPLAGNPCDHPVAEKVLLYCNCSSKTYCIVYINAYNTVCSHSGGTQAYGYKAKVCSADIPLLSSLGSFSQALTGIADWGVHSESLVIRESQSSFLLGAM